MATHLTNIAWTKEISKQDINICRDICKNYGKKYYLATLFLPKNERYSTWVLYSFFRIADEIVDTEDIDSETASLKLKKLSLLWKSLYESKVYDNQNSTNIILSLTRKVFENYEIPFEYSESFFEAMLSDTTKTRYNTYTELQKYMYGSAAVVGLMMANVIGYDDKGTPEAILLGEAMQMTNFLRDIKEDFVLRSRIYLPGDELIKYNISDSRISMYCESQKIDEDFKEYMKIQISKNRLQYKMANIGITYLNQRGRLGVYMASYLYEKILDKIEQNEYNVFNKRVSVSLKEKIIIILYTIWKVKIKK